METALATTNDRDAYMQLFGGSAPQMPNNAALPVFKMQKDVELFTRNPGENFNEIIGHIIFMHDARAYFDVPFDEREPGKLYLPRCHSSDGIYPAQHIELPDGSIVMPMAATCAECEMNKFETSASGRGKACGEEVRMWILPVGESFPSFMRVRATSAAPKKPLKVWWVDQCSKYKAYQPVLVRLSLKLERRDVGNTTILQVESVKQGGKDVLAGPEELQVLHSMYQSCLRLAKTVTEDE